MGLDGRRIVLCLQRSLHHGLQLPKHLFVPLHTFHVTRVSAHNSQRVRSAARSIQKTLFIDIDSRYDTDTDSVARLPKFLSI